MVRPGFAWLLCTAMNPFTERQLRDAFGYFATGITVVTTRDREDHPIGVTANSLSSVSLNPPLLSFCLDRQAFAAAHFADTGAFAINILRDDQEHLSATFAKPRLIDWSQIVHEPGASGLPLLAGCLAAFECRRYASYDGGDHIIYLGEITAIHVRGASGDPLLYFKGRYRRLAPDQP